LNLYFLAIFGLVFTTFIWGITFELVEESLKSIPPNIFNAIRFFIASLCALILIIIRNGKVSFSNFEIKTGLICAMLLSLGYFFQSLGLWENSFFLKSDPNKSAFITGTSVLMVPIIMYIMNKGKISSHLWVSIFFVLLGMAVLLNPKVEKFTFGDILTFFCATSFAAHIIFQGDYLKNGIKDIFNFFLALGNNFKIFPSCNGQRRYPILRISRLVSCWFSSNWRIHGLIACSDHLHVAYRFVCNVNYLCRPPRVLKGQRQHLCYNHKIYN